MDRAGVSLGDIFNIKIDNSIWKSRLNQSYIRTVDARGEDEQAIRESQKRICQIAYT